MNKEEVIEALKDEENFAAAARVIDRAGAVVEVEELTPYPVPRRKMGERMDGYNMAVLNDESIQAMKAQIGCALMSEAWSDDLTTAEGWKDLSERLPDAEVVAEVDGNEYTLVPWHTGFRLGECPPINALSVRELVSKIQSNKVAYRLAGIGLFPQGVLFDHSANRVIITLRKILVTV